MASPRSAPSARFSAKVARRRAERAESLSGSVRQFLTPNVWKQAHKAQRQYGPCPGVRWSLQPLIMV